MGKKIKKPPGLAKWLFNKMSRYEEKYSILNDVEEVYYTIIEQKGFLRAYIWYWYQTVLSFIKYIKLSIIWSFIMFKNYLKIAFRNMKRQKVYALINIFGLAAALSCCILIYLYAANEYSFDGFHKNKDSLYRFIQIGYNPDGSEKFPRYPHFPAVMSNELTEFFPEIQYHTRFNSGWGRVMHKDELIWERISMADVSFFEMFSFPLIYGNSKTALYQDNAIVLTRSYAKKYFGRENPIGKTLTIDYQYGDIKKEYIVTGLTEDVPGNSIFQYNMIMNISNLPVSWGYNRALTNWYDFNTPVYFQLKDNISIKNVEQKLPAFFDAFFGMHAQRERIRGAWIGKGHQFSLGLQKLTDIHLDPNVWGGTDPIYLYALTGIAIIILSIACVNFINISIGMSSIRSTEIGIRKVIGAQKKQLVRQFWSESFIMCCIAMATGLAFAILLLPKFNEFVSGQIKMADIISINRFPAIILILITTGFFAGSYPAIVMAHLRPVDILKGSMKFGNKKFFSKSLVVIQFTLSIILILSAVIMRNQITFMIDKYKGYDIEGLLSARIQESNQNEAQRVVRLFRENIISHKDIYSISACTNTFGRGYSHEIVIYNDREILFYKNQIDHDFINTLGLEIIEGRDFSRHFSSDSLGVIVNQQFIKEMGGLKSGSPIGKIIGEPSKGFPHNMRIIGVVKDFHFRSLHRKIYPTIFHLYPDNGLNNMIIRISQNNMNETISFLEKKWKEIQPDRVFTFSFLKEDLEDAYNAERRWNEIINYSSIFAAIIACLGIFGLTSISLNRRVKEIGIRKVLGAGVIRIIRLIVKDFILLIIIANIIACPAAYFITSGWLENFAYRDNPGIFLFMFIGLLTLSVAVTTICIQSIKAANANPVDSLKYE